MIAWAFKSVMGLGILLLASCGGGGSTPVEIAVGSKAPDFSLTSLDGTKLKSQAYDGDIVVLNFWATWCQNCKKELPDLQKVTETTQAKVIGIALDEGGSKTVKPFVKKNKINYTVALGDQRVFNHYRGIAIPYTLLLDREQRIVKIYRGPIPEGDLEREIRKLS